MNNNWLNYIDTELNYFRPKLLELGFSLSTMQPHLKGERSAFRSEKLILLGERKSDSLKVIIKVSREKNGIFEIEEERKGRTALSEIKFSYTVFNDPEEIYFNNKNGELIAITRFIEEEKKRVKDRLLNKVNKKDNKYREEQEDLAQQWQKEIETKYIEIQRIEEIICKA